LSPASPPWVASATYSSLTAAAWAMNSGFGCWRSPPRGGGCPRTSASPWRVGQVIWRRPPLAVRARATEQPQPAEAMSAVAKGPDRNLREEALELRLGENALFTDHAEQLPIQLAKPHDSHQPIPHSGGTDRPRDAQRRHS
jgi:hypothetical protein